MLSEDFIQFVCSNVLHIHARRHPNKRLYVKGEDNPHSFIGKKNIKFQTTQLFIPLVKEDYLKREFQ